MTKVNKLVRDKIPQLIKSEGKVPIFCKLTDNENFYSELCKKLIEETLEFVESGELEELADIVEVVEAILSYKNITLSELMQIKEKKATANGKFKERYFLLSVE